jgi:hypothetical protein
MTAVQLVLGATPVCVYWGGGAANTHSSRQAAATGVSVSEQPTAAAVTASGGSFVLQEPDVCRCLAPPPPPLHTDRPPAAWSWGANSQVPEKKIQ